MESFHVVKRRLPIYDAIGGIVIQPLQDNALCFEKQLGNLLALTNSVKLLIVNREEEYAPIIYEKGFNSPEDAAIALSNLHKKWISYPSKIPIVCFCCS